VEPLKTGNAAGRGDLTPACEHVPALVRQAVSFGPIWTGAVGKCQTGALCRRLRRAGALAGPQLLGWIEKKIENWLGLEINRDKTRVVDLGEEKASLDFPGYTFRWHRDQYGRKQRYLHVGPSKKALQRERERINEMTDRRQGCTPIPRLIDRLNRQLKGWGNYFSFGYPSRAYRKNQLASRLSAG
jgi:RNA-directed DNA polymerase